MGPPPDRKQRRFSYYGRLAAADKRTYRKSDGVTAVELSGAAALRPSVGALEAALASGRRLDVERCSRALCNGIATNLGVPPVSVKVRSVRPAERGGELHGLYTWEEGKRPLIEVWMRTARNQNVVAFRTFLRTLLHEVCHHLDFTLLELPDTFHTEGFFRRESSLVRQLAGSRSRNPKGSSGMGQPREGDASSPSARPRRAARPSTAQLKLFE